MIKLKAILTKRTWVILAGFVLCVVLILTSGFFSREYDPFLTIQRARVLSVDDSLLSEDPHVANMQIGRQIVEVEILTGNHTGRRVRFESTVSRHFNVVSQEGMELLVQVRENSDGSIAYVGVQGHSRATFLYVFVGLFLLVLIVIGRKKGLFSVLSLLFTITVVVFFMIPLIINGFSPVLAAIITAALTTLFSIFVVSDVSPKGVSAVAGTLFGVLIAGVISVIAGRFAHVSGMQLEHAEEVFFHMQGGAIIRVPELLFAGIIISSLGAVIDIAMSISSVIFEIKDVDKTIGLKQLYSRGMNIGRDIMGTMSNTLILAFAGSSVTVMVIIALYRFPYIQLINLNLLALEIVQGISASFALVVTVPITAIFAAFMATKFNKK